MSGYITPSDLVSLGHNLSQISEEVLTGICKRASAMVDAYLQQPLGLTESVEYQQALGTGRIITVFPDYLPVHEVTQMRFVKADGSFFVVTHGIRAENSRGCISLKKDPSVVLDTSEPVEITYKHGYEAIPDDAKQAVILTAKVLLDEYVATKMTGLGGAGAVSDGGRSVSRQASVQEVPEAAKALLVVYRRVR